MPKAYWIARVDVDDEVRYRDYIAANAAVFAKYGARFIVRGGPFDAPEGVARARNVVLEFPSLQAARDCYHSAEYKVALDIRTAVARSELIIIEGYDGPQPG
ncbi:MAG: hypothetical protein BGP12_18880 [Rhodospirillales bacterium 70-18]|nr:DUF1330 domain-containing protein [Rhodospirillales bacterium]OJY65264.1 MAG: hypothetical protein BGP12_18880 [Rhodospirillales bacterium 70-18]